MKTKPSINGLLSLAVGLAFLIPAVTRAASTVTFDNQSGRPALVKLVGPTASSVSVEHGKKESAAVAPGHYFIKVRYGKPGGYSYSKGEEFDVKETPTTASVITITLHKVVAGNYDSRPMTEKEFDADSAPPAKIPDTQPTVSLSENRLKFKWGTMTTQKEEIFPSSIAFWPSDTMLVLLFRNFDAPVTKFRAQPPDGKGAVVIMLRKGDRFSGFSKVTPGTYSPGIMEKGMLWPIGVLVIGAGSPDEFGIGVFWNVSDGGKAEMGLAGPGVKISAAKIRELLQNIGTVILGEVGEAPGKRVIGQLLLGDGKQSNLKQGNFSIPVVETPDDFVSK